MVEQESDLSLRYHHLEQWFWVANKFEDFFGARPSEISEPVFNDSLKEFTEGVSDEIVLFYTDWRRKIEESPEEMNKARIELDPDDPLAYIKELIGTSKEEEKEHGRRIVDHFIEIITVARRDENAPLVLNGEPDGICRACIFFKHCVNGSSLEVTSNRELRKSDRKYQVALFAIFGMFETEIVIKIGALFDPKFQKRFKLLGEW